LASEAPPAELRLLDSPAAQALARLTATFEDLQNVLKCCERLVTEVAPGNHEPDDVVVEALWTSALLSYARCFTGGDAEAAVPANAVLTAEDLTATQTHADVLEWHTILIQLRDHYANPAENPRERFSVGVAQGPDGTASGIAVTSARQPLVDDLTVRQTGAIAFSLRDLLNERINSLQSSVFEEAARASAEDLNKLPLVEVTTSD
jgi:hypothetical protein